MNRLTDVELAGKVYTLNLSVKALITLAPIFGSEPKDIINAVHPPDGANTSLFSETTMKNVARIGAVLSESGANYRREFEGRECGTLTAEGVEALNVFDYIKLRGAVIAVIAGGGKREIEAETNPKNADATQGR